MNDDWKNGYREGYRDGINDLGIFPGKQIVPTTPKPIIPWEKHYYTSSYTCLTCGIELKGGMGYCCTNPNCTTYARGT
jgi:hypothetical protein